VLWSWLLIIAATGVWMAHWYRFPLFLDYYYHLHTARGFLRVGGVALHNFWDGAPAGYPHLYPPVIPLLLGCAVRCGVSPLAVMRWPTALMFPMLLVVLRWLSCRWYGPRTSWWMVVAALIPYTLFLQCATAPAAAASLLLLLLLYGAIERGRHVAAGCLFGAIWYTHPGMPWVALLSLLVAIVLWPERRAVVVRALVLGMVLATPWLMHLSHHLGAFTAISIQENRFVEIYPVLYLLAAIGGWVGWCRGRDVRVLLALVIGCLPMLPVFRYRFFNGEGLLPVVLLAGYGLSWVHERLAVRPIPVRAKALALAVAVAAWACSPSMGVVQRPIAAAWGESTPWRLLTWMEQEPKGNDAGLYEGWMEDAADRVRRLTASDEIIWCNYRFIATLLGSMADRAVSVGSLFYGSSRPQVGELMVSSSVFVWIKDPDPDMVATHRRVLERYSLELMEETDLAAFYRQPGVTARMQPVSAVVPLGVAWALLALLAGAGVWDYRRNDVKRSS